MWIVQSSVWWDCSNLTINESTHYNKRQGREHKVIEHSQVTAGTSYQLVTLFSSWRAEHSTNRVGTDQGCAHTASHCNTLQYTATHCNTLHMPHRESADVGINTLPLISLQHLDVIHVTHMNESCHTCVTLHTTTHRLRIKKEKEGYQVSNIWNIFNKNRGRERVGGIETNSLHLTGKDF